MPGLLPPLPQRTSNIRIAIKQVNERVLEIPEGLSSSSRDVV